VSLSDVKAMLLAGEIVDQFTIVALAYAGWRDLLDG
jgi:hypothetical protein